MYLSKLIFNTHSIKTRRLLMTPYTLHKAIFHAFPDTSDGGPGRVLYRVDEDNGSSAVYLLVQSEKEPNWDRAELLLACLAQPPQCKIFTPSVKQGQMFYFRLRANPTIKRNGKRVGLLQEESQLAWLKRKGDGSGFSIKTCTATAEGMLKDKKQVSVAKEFDLSLFSVRFNGILRVEKTEIFLGALRSGIGSAKGLGFGLLSIAPLKEG